jgi:hypothetical protein
MMLLLGPRRVLCGERNTRAISMKLMTKSHPTSVCVCMYVFCLCAVCVCVRVDVREECAHASCMHHASCIMHHVCHACWPQCEILGDIFVRPSANTDLTSDTHTCVGPSTMVLCSLSRLCPAVRALDDIL